MRLETKFQDEDFVLGEVVKAKVTTYYDGDKVVVMADRARGGVSRFEYNSIKDFTDHWEDAPDVPEEPKEYWYIDWTPEIGVYHTRDTGSDADERQKEIGNYFETKEEAEKAVEKLKAWKRLRDKGFRFNGWIREHKKGSADVTIASFIDEDYDATKDLDLLFGGEE